MISLCTLYTLSTISIKQSSYSFRLQEVEKENAVPLPDVQQSGSLH